MLLLDSRQEAILERARPYCCAGQARWYIEVGQTDKAEKLVDTAVSLINDASEFGFRIRDAVRIHIAHAHFALAAATVAKARKRKLKTLGH